MPALGRCSEMLDVSRKQAILAIAIFLAVTSSLAGAYPLTNIVVNDNQGGWFTVDNIETYGDDLDERVGDGYVFTGHPSYVADSDARLLMNMSRIHYFALSFDGTAVGDRFFQNLTNDLRNGTAKWAIGGPMTTAILEHNETAKTAFLNHYCIADDQEAQRLYNRTGGTLYIYVENGSECPPERQPDLSDDGHS